MESNQYVLPEKCEDDIVNVEVKCLNMGFCSLFCSIFFISLKRKVQIFAIQKPCSSGSIEILKTSESLQELLEIAKQFYYKWTSQLQGVFG